MGQNLSSSSPGANIPSPSSNSSSNAGSNHQNEIVKISGKRLKNEKEVNRLREELLSTKRHLYERDQQLLKLHREIHKLKQHLPRGSLSPPFSAPIKKCGVSGESLVPTSLSIVKIEKDFRSRQLIKEALLDNTFLQNSIDTHQLRLIIDAMYEKEFSKGTLLCEQGTFGSHLYVIAYGHCQIITDDEPVNTVGPGKAFGELAILYNCARTATVKALTKVRVWVLDRRMFHAIMVQTGKDRRLQYKTFLKR
ncbi:cGMP-dependent protein kinase: isozyme 1-like protein [Dinothrombium tinctorium]|uniref:cGMP-dependent protein kinase: isozyme 1-like protein n=1 Tax=Dinothrombium tinctorium TaxID=1965070 RepID=A0A3S4QZY0_9ACAR|nr:cGMP-dependent protein kinase: isozyme 1-like protein [Dinothrombium tinctorium]RWS09853.1 cGMP-dependent protein kinase: isozyme 1-like protein [Dinothrombium tinctorium]